MLLMMGEVLEFSEMSRNFPESETWRFLAHHQSHIEWTGITLHDMIQPSFSFLVGRPRWCFRWQADGNGGESLGFSIGMPPGAPLF